MCTASSFLYLKRVYQGKEEGKETTFYQVPSNVYIFIWSCLRAALSEDFEAINCTTFLFGCLPFLSLFHGTGTGNLEYGEPLSPVSPLVKQQSKLSVAWTKVVIVEHKSRDSQTRVFQDTKLSFVFFGRNIWQLKDTHTHTSETLNIYF